ncbi:MaoC family dehydratase [Aurantiacibacter luteus]|uniref:Dehydratase n=1 Tax=Aurantiacibacter luteus TaxID=1581420 RepID=A0A0G9MV27_9SPHN|nr:MaoC family dehydratase [Aurantiacibacter luteus]KLE34565.1 dehydratase [Aurantiacibacter luteus]
MSEALWLDDLKVGDSFTSGEHAMTEAEIVAYASQFDPQSFHTDPEAAKDSFFGGLAASGWHTAAITMRLMVEALPFARGVIGAGGELSWPEPTRPGDVLHVEARIEDIVPSRSRPGRAAVAVHCRTLDRHGNVKQDFRPRLIAWSRGSDLGG